MDIGQWSETNGGKYACTLLKTMYGVQSIVLNLNHDYDITAIVRVSSQSDRSLHFHLRRIEN